MNLHAQCVLQAPFNETFDTNATPTCWSNYSQGYGANVKWQFANPTTSPKPPWYGYHFNEHTGNGGYYAFTRFDFNTDYTIQLPNISIVGTVSPVLSFFCNHPAYAPKSPQEQLSIEFKNGTTWQVVKSVTAYSFNWQYIQVDVPAWAGDTISVRLVATSNTSSFPSPFLIDDVFVGQKPSCTGPDSIYVKSTTSTTALLKWIGDTGTYQVGFGEFYEPHASTIKQLSVTDSLLISNLTPATLYQIYVRKMCGADTGYWIGPIDFLTDCELSASIPYTQNFDVLSPLDTQSIGQICWSAYASGATKWLPNRNETYSGNTGPFGDYSALKGGVYMYTEATGGSFADTSDLISPNILINPKDSAFLVFGYHMYGSGTGSLQVDIFDGLQWQNGLFVITGQQQTSSTDPYINAVLPLQNYINDSIVLRFRAIRGNSGLGDIAVDAVQVIDSCVFGYPVALFTESYDSLTSNGFYISFTSFASNANQTIWYFGDGASDTGQFVVHAYQANGTYTAWQVVQNQCGRVDSVSAIIQIAGIGVKENIRLIKPKVYPNPASGHVVVATILPGSNIQIFSVNGEQVLSLLAERPNETIDISSLSNGVYILSVRSGSTWHSQKLVVRHE
jgi:hypothetical protein